MIMDKISICSLNCQGLGDNKKRRDVLDYLRKKNHSIICLQDTHFTKNIENLIRSEWGYKVFFSSFSSQSRGVAIFLRNNFEYILHGSYNDQQGNVLILDIEIENHRMTFVNLYGPNSDKPNFYENLQKRILTYGNRDILIVGDWNLLLDPTKDGLNYKHINNPNARQAVLRLMTELNLFDVWREENIEQRLYTWRRKLKPGTIQMGRLDFFLISESLAHYSRDEKINPSYRSDHSIISLSLLFNETPKPKNYWKFNNSLLKNEQYIKEIKEVILNVKKQYAASPYNLENIQNINDSSFQTTINPQLFFEMLLIEIRSKTISFSTALKKKEKSDIAILTAEIKVLEDMDPTKNFDTIKTKQDELKLIREKQLQGNFIRSRARWVEQGEKASRYFCHLENRSFVSKRMTSLYDNKGNEIHDNNKISNEVYSFYSNLYSSKEQDIVDVELTEILDPDTPKLSDAQANSLEGYITLREAGEVLYKMENNKSPGSTGFSSEFFKFFWKDLGNFLVNSLNYSFDQRELSTTQKEGIITCIPKGNKSKKYIKNWRPISLLNISYKIGSGCIANRFKNILEIIIDLDQSGFVSGRFIGDNIRLLYDVINFSKEQNKTGLLLLIDFEKAFDSVAWSFIKKSLVYFNFKNDIIQWIETFYKRIKSTVIINGNPTPWFPIERGCRQGDPISPYIFLICSEVLAHMIRQNKNIKGYSLFEKEIKISQLADDTSLFLDGSQESFEYCVRTILEYAKYSGLAMNFDKTKVVWIGCEHPPDTIYLPELNFDWNPETFTVLGIEFTAELKDITDININKKITDMTKDLNNWSKRNLTPFGKIVVLKSLILSKIVHILTSLPSPSKKLIKELNSLFYNFLWDGKPDKIKRSIGRQKLINGGIQMIDLEAFDQSLKLSWLRRLFNSQSKWKELIQAKYPKIFDIPKFGNNFVEKLFENIQNPFWGDVINYLMKYTKKFYMNYKDCVSSCSFLFNENMKIGKSCIKNNILIEHNIFYIFQLKEGENFLNHNEFSRKYNIQINFLHYRSIIAAVKKYSSKFPIENTTKPHSFQPHLIVIMKTKKGVSPIYQEIIKLDYIKPSTIKWQSVTEITTEQWMNSFIKLKTSTSDTKLRWLQYRILHSILTTNRSVSKFKLDQSDLCQFCNAHSETIHHLIWSCQEVNKFWKDLATLLNRRCNHTHNFTFNEILVIFGISNQIKTDNVCDLIILMAKYFIYRCKVQRTKLNLQYFIKEVYNRYLVEKIIYENAQEFRNSWGPYEQLFQGLF